MADPVQTAAPATPDVSGASQPGAAAMTPAPAASVAPANPAAAAQAQAAPYLANEAQATQNATNLAMPDPPPAPVPHQRLLSMVQGLSLGLSAAATSIATHGAEGGAKEVIQVQQAQKEAQQRAQEFAAQQKNAKIQQQITVGQTNHVMAQNILMNAQFPNQMAESDLNVQKGKLGVIGDTQDIRTKALQDFQTTGDLAAYQDTLKKTGDVSGAKSGTTGASPNTIPPVAMSQWKNSVDTAVGSYPDDPDIKAAQQQYESASKLTDPQAASTAMASAARVALNRKSALDVATESKTKQSVAAKDELAQGQARAANSIWQKQVPKDAQGNPTQDFETWQKTKQKELEHAVTTGNLDDAGKLLATGFATLADLRARGTTEGDILTAIKHAQKYEPTYNPSDEIVGEQSMKIPGNQVFYGSARSLAQQGGALDQLVKAHEKLGNTKFPAINTVADLIKYQAGDDALSTYKIALLSAADDYSKVMSGGSGSDTSRNEAQDKFIYSMTHGAIQDAAEQARQSVQSQVEGRIGNNRYVRQREGDILTKAGAGTSSAGLNKTAENPSGLTTSLKAAMALPVNKGKTADQVRADIVSHGHMVSD